MKEIVLQKKLITVEVNPLQVAILMDVLNGCLPDIKYTFENLSEIKLTMNFSDIEKAVVDIYTYCYSETELYEDAKQIFTDTGAFPDIHSLLVINAKKTFHIPGPGEMKSLEFEVVPVQIMMMYLFLRGYFDQFQTMMMTRFSELVFLDFGAMQISADAIYEASIAGTGVKEMAEPMVEVYKLTGQLPDGMKN